MELTPEVFDELQRGVQKLLSEQFPYTRTSFINSAAESATRSALIELWHLKTHATKGVRKIGLLDLPAEVRNRIYGYAVQPSCGKSILIGCFNTAVTTDVDEFCNYSTHCTELSKRGLPGLPGITQACRQLREETLAMFYQLNTFATFLQTPYDMDLMRRWLKASDAEGIRHISQCIIYYKPSNFVIDPRVRLDDDVRRQLARNDALERLEAMLGTSDVDMPFKDVMKVTEWGVYAEDPENSL